MVCEARAIPCNVLYTKRQIRTIYASFQVRRPLGLKNLVATSASGTSGRTEAEMHGHEEEALKYFIKRLEGKGWDNARETLQGDERMASVWKAMASIYGHGVLETKLLDSPWLTEAVQRSRIGTHDAASSSSEVGHVLLKMENEQVTGSFKARGATFKVLHLSGEERRKGLVISSTGNHALAVMNALKSVLKSNPGETIPLDVYLPQTTHSRKLAKIERLGEGLGAKIHLIGEDCVEAEQLARQKSIEEGKTYISPYNDNDVIAGQGTIALEILMQRSPDELDCVFVPVGGGGLISGIAHVMKTIAPHVKVIGCQAENSDVMRQSVIANKVVCIPWIETLAEGAAGGIEVDSITLDDCSNFVDHWVTVSEAEIASAMVGIHGHHSTQIEGAAAVTIASMIKMAPALVGKNAVGIICGGNVSSESLDVAYDIVRGVKDEKVRPPERFEGKASAF
jgi:threonine dehydratase